RHWVGMVDRVGLLAPKRPRERFALAFLGLLDQWIRQLGEREPEHHVIGHEAQPLVLEREDHPPHDLLWIDRFDGDIRRLVAADEKEPVECPRERAEPAAE